LSVIRAGVIVERFDASVVYAGQLIDRLQHDRLQGAQPIHGHDRAADAISSIRGSESVFAPLFWGGKELNHLVQLGQPIVRKSERDTIERHGFALRVTERLEGDMLSGRLPADKPALR
jgi:hypothetical protein